MMMLVMAMMMMMVIMLVVMLLVVMVMVMVIMVMVKPLQLSLLVSLISRLSGPSPLSFALSALQPGLCSVLLQIVFKA